MAELKPADLAESPLRAEGAAAQRELRAEGDALLGDELERLEHVHVLAHHRPRAEAHAGAFARAREWVMVHVRGGRGVAGAFVLGERRRGGGTRAAHRRARV